VNTIDFYGTGLDYPLRMSLTGEYGSSTGVENIRSQLRFVILTPIGSVLGQPDFGTNLVNMVHEQLDWTTAEFIKVDIAKAIAKWVPEVRLINIVVLAKFDENLLYLVLNYEILKYNKVDNYVIPYKYGTRPSLPGSR